MCFDTFSICATLPGSLGSELALGAGSEKDAGQYGPSSSDSEDESPPELQLTGRRPSTNYRPEFAAKTLAQASSRCKMLPYDWLTHAFVLCVCC